MKYKNEQYAEALYEALNGKTGADTKKIIGGFLSAVRKRKDSAKVNRILKNFERIYLKKNGLKKIELESASKLSAPVLKEVFRISGGKVVIVEKINPEVLGGVNILVDDFTSINASARTRLADLFSKVGGKS